MADKSVPARPAPWHHAGIVLAIGRRQIDDRPQPAGDEESGLELSISVTTRKRRGSEIDGVHYHFLILREFERLRDTDELLEWAEVHGHFYGSPREPVESAIGRGPRHAVRYRLAGRAPDHGKNARRRRPRLHPSAFDGRTESPPQSSRRGCAASHRKRLANALVEIHHWRDYDYVVINDDLDRAFHEVSSILMAERLAPRPPSRPVRLSSPVCCW